MATVTFQICPENQQIHNTSHNTSCRDKKRVQKKRNSIPPKSKSYVLRSSPFILPDTAANHWLGERRYIMTRYDSHRCLFHTRRTELGWMLSCPSVWFDQPKSSQTSLLFLHELYILSPPLYDHFVYVLFY